MNYLFAGFIIGFLGSFHCIGMCGPIAFALPINNKSTHYKFFGILIYNFGRILTYATLGALTGLIGSGAATFGLQQILSIVIGGILLLSVVAPAHFINDILGTGKIYFLVSKLKAQFSLLLNRKRFSSLFSIGLLNGLLPCGMVYMAIAAAVSLGSFTQSILFMSAFGLATLPVMLSISFFGNRINNSYGSSLKKIMPVIVIVMAFILIVRGLNLGIPYLSPERINSNEQMVSCHDSNIINCSKK